jgi:sortase A
VRRLVREVGLGLITLGVIILLFVAYQLFGTNVTEHHNQSKLAGQFQAATGPAPSPVSKNTSGCSVSGAAKSGPLPRLSEGDVTDHLQIPKIGLSKYVVEGTSENDLRLGPGHYPGTALPGQTGNAAIAGHRTTYGAPFFELNRMAPGDPICLTDVNNRVWVYQVSAPPQVVSPNDVAVLDPTPLAQLTLTTCNPRFEATSRLVVFARLIGQALPPSPAVASTPAPPALAGVDNLGSGNSKAWQPTILFALLVLVLWVAVRIWINRSRRWHRLAAYVIGISVCLIPLWFVFENAIRLLPQSI